MDNNVKIALVHFQSNLNCPDENVEKAVEIIKQMSLSDSSVKSRRMGHRIAALIMVGVIAVGICLSIIL